jgi:hypothetical protein
MMDAAPLMARNVFGMPFDGRMVTRVILSGQRGFEARIRLDNT